MSATVGGAEVGPGAVVVSMVTVLVGMVALGSVATTSASPAVRRLVAGHLTLALGGIVSLLVAVVASSSGIAWVSFAVFVGTGLLGLSLLLRARAPAVGPGPVPLPVVVLHGAAALVTILLVLLTAVGVART